MNPAPAEVLAEHELPALPEPLPRPVIDSHTHLDTTQEYTGVDPADLLAAAASVNVNAVAQIGCDVASSRYAVELARTTPTVIAAVAIHPNDAAAHPDTLDTDLAVIDALAAEGGRVRAVGETGLDYFRTTDADAQALQRQAFAAHIAIAKRHGLTLAIHDRDAHDDVVEVLDAEGWPDRVIFHCFSGDADFARRVLEHGCWLSFPGVVTYKANAHLRDALRVTPRDRVLVETDAPFLTPVPERGKRNGSYLIPHTVRFMAETRGDDLDALCGALWTNAEAAYGGPWCERPGAAA